MVMAFTGHTDAQAAHPVQSSSRHSTGRGAAGASGGSSGRAVPSMAAFR